MALVEPSPGLLDAVAVALSPWGLRVIATAGPIPTTDMDAATARASSIAGERRAAAVVWIAAPPGTGASLWLFDAQTGEMMVRPLSQRPPFDEASAAAIALTVKTLLRSTTVAPAKERASEPAPTTSSGPSPSASVVPSGSVLPPSSPPPAAPAPTASNGAPSLAPAPGHAWRVEALALARLPTGVGATIAPRVGLGVTYWPGVWSENLGFGVDGRAGTSLYLATPTFTGTFSDTAIGFSVRGRIGAGRFSVELAAGPSLHFTSLSGAEIATGHTSSIQRGDAAFGLAAIPQLSLGSRLRVGLCVGADALLRTQRYVLDENVILSIPAVAFDLGARASLALD